MTPEEKRKKLETLPWQALFDAAIQKDVEAAKLNGKDKSEIIELLIHQAMISDSEVDGLVNDYIYGNRITFTLWTFSDALGEEDYAKVQALEGTTEAYLRADGFRGLRILSVKDCGDRLEVLYVYSKEYSYIDETGHSASVWEQHRGCLWIGVGTTYLACISKHDKMTSCIVSHISSKLRKILTQIKPPKAAIERCINWIARSRVVLQGADGAKTIISRSEGLTVEQHEEINRIKDDRFDTSGSYIAQISDDKQATVKYNVKKGSIGIYKHLPAPVLFEWSRQAINIILEEIAALKGKPAAEIYKELGLELKWSAMSEIEKDQANWFLSALIASINHDEYSCEIPGSIGSLLNKQALFQKIPRVYCNMCESYEMPYCSECEHPLKTSRTGDLICECGAPHSIQCPEGHRDCFVEHWYLPTDRFLRMMNQNLRNAFPDESVNYHMIVMGTTLHIIHAESSDSGAELLFDDAECFHSTPIATQPCTRKFAVRMKEKCSGTCSKAKIEKCVNNPDMFCLPKVFYGILPGYRPQPHTGYEYGDVSGEIKCRGRSYEMIGIIKKNSLNKSTSKNPAALIESHLLSTSAEGQEILRQFVEQGMSDARTDVIAIIAPQYFDSSLKGTLRYLARMSGKKIMFIGLDEICRLLEANDAIAVPRPMN